MAKRAARGKPQTPMPPQQDREAEAEGQPRKEVEFAGRAGAPAEGAHAEAVTEQRDASRVAERHEVDGRGRERAGDGTEQREVNCLQFSRSGQVPFRG